MASSDINSIVIVGRLTRDADLRYTNSGYPIASLSIAVNSSKKDGDQWITEASFFDVSHFGKSAEALKPYLTKGKQIAVQGSLRQDRWEKDGQTHSRVVINADSIQLLGGKSESSGASGFGAPSSDFNGGYQRRTYNQPAQNFGYKAADSGYTPADASDSFGGDAGGISEDIPF